MSEPVDPAADFLLTRGDVEEVTVESLDSDAAEGADVLFTATGVRAVVGPLEESEPAVGAGGQTAVGFRDFTLVAGDMTFDLKARDRITRSDATRYHVGPDVKLGGFGGLWSAKKCVREQ